MLAGYGLKHGLYILYVGNLEPRKNISGILKAYACLSRALRERFPLVFVGRKS